MIVINFKNYKLESKALKLAKKIEKYLPKAIVCPAAVDIENISKNTKLKVLAQNADIEEGNRATGYNTLMALKEAGAEGTLINHSEHSISIVSIRKLLVLSRKVNMKIIACSSNLKEVKKIISLKPWAIAFEEPKLIATKKSITQYAPETIKKFMKIISRTKIIPLCGAGINSAEDIKQAYALGCKGVLIASAIANIKNPVPLLKQISKI